MPRPGRCIIKHRYGPWTYLLWNKYRVCTNDGCYHEQLRPIEKGDPTWMNPKS